MTRTIQSDAREMHFLLCFNTTAKVNLLLSDKLFNNDIGLCESHCIHSMYNFDFPNLYCDTQMC